MIEATIKRLEMAILTGELKPRERLIESELISRFNVKRFTVRKAIHELAHQGLVELTPNKGARVVDTSDKEVEDIYRVRMNLEFLAAEIIMETLTPEKLAHLKEIQKEYVRAVNSGRFEEMVSKNEAFHRGVYEMTENRFLVEHLVRLTNAIFALRYNAYFLLGIAQRTVADHEAVIRAIQKKDLEGLKHILKESIIYPKMIYLSRKTSPLLNGKLEKDQKRAEKKSDKRGRITGRERKALPLSDLVR